MSDRKDVATLADDQRGETPKLGGASRVTQSVDEFRTRFLVPTITTLAVVLLFVVGGVTTPSFLSGDNLLNILQVASLTGIIALGVTFLTLSGNFFSLSLEQTGALCSIVFAATVAGGWPWPLALVAAIAVGCATGAVQGVFVGLGANPIIVTIAGGAAIFGLAAVVTSSRAQIIRGQDVGWLGSIQPLGIPITTWAFVVLAIVCQVVLVKTRFGRSLILVGSNRPAARAVGLPIGRISWGTFVLAGGFAALAGAFVAAQSNRGLVSNLEGANLDVVAAVLVGGTSIQGGEGSMFRTALGAIFIASLQNILILRGYSSGPRQLVLGLAVVLGVSLFWIAKGGRSR